MVPSHRRSLPRCVCGFGNDAKTKPSSGPLMSYKGTVRLGDTSSGAILSECGRYRFRLWRRWKSGFYARPTLGFVMLNPSTADHAEDDPTIRRCIGFAKDNGFSAIHVVNLFAWRATDPDELKSAEDPVGRLNDSFIENAALSSSRLVAAWGAAKVPRIEERAEKAATIAWDVGRPLVCLGTTKAGAPRHPLYLPKSATFQEWKSAA